MTRLFRAKINLASVKSAAIVVSPFDEGFTNINKEKWNDELHHCQGARFSRKLRSICDSRKIWR